MKVCSQIVAGAFAGLAMAWNVQAAGAPPVEVQGVEYPLTLRLPGDQVFPRIALGTTGGILVWQDAAIDGQGLGIAAQRLNGSLSAEAGGAFAVNEVSAGDQENARVVLLPGGGAFFAWQGGTPGFPRISGRILGPDGTFTTGDFAIGSGEGEHQLDPEVAVLSNGQVIVVWSSYRQAGEHYDVYARRFAASGEPIGPEFRVNETVGLNRRSATVAATADGGFIVVWVGERELGMRNNRDGSGIRVPGTGSPVFEVALYARSFDAADEPASGESKVSGSDGVAAHPALAPLGAGRFALAWTRRDPQSRSNSLDIATRVLTAEATALGDQQRLNTYAYGDQYRPLLASTPSGAFAVWSSMGQDGSWEGVYGRALNSRGLPEGEELRLNSTTAGGQIYPALAGSSEGRLLVAWSANLPRTGMEIFAQRLVTRGGLPAAPAPTVTPLTSSSLMVSWPAVTGMEVASYRIFGEGGAQLAEVEGNSWTQEGLAPSTTAGFELAYVLTSGQVSPRSAASSGKTWGADRNYDGLPDDWQALWWPNSAKYPAGSEDSDVDGMTNLEEWLAGTNPTDAGSSLRVRGQMTALGLRLEWSTQPGFVYQLQSSSQGSTWGNVGSPRFAAGGKDAVTLPASGASSLFRVLRIR